MSIAELQRTRSQRIAERIARLSKAAKAYADSGGNAPELANELDEAAQAAGWNLAKVDRLVTDLRQLAALEPARKDLAPLHARVASAVRALADYDAESKAGELKIVAARPVQRTPSGGTVFETGTSQEQSNFAHSRPPGRQPLARALADAQQDLAAAQHTHQRVAELKLQTNITAPIGA